MEKDTSLMHFKDNKIDTTLKLHQFYLLSLSSPQQDKLNLEVRAIFAHNCYQCHSENRQEGELVLDNKRGVFKGGESGPVITAGEPGQSELYRRITLGPDHDEVMPKKGKVLAKNEINLIELWISQGAHWADRAVKVFPEAELALEKPKLPGSDAGQHPVDRLVGDYFKKNGIRWPSVVDDRKFIRRAYLDITGLLPAPEEVNAFLEDDQPDKRSQLIDRLLQDDHTYTQHWLSFWNDLFKIGAG